MNARPDFWSAPPRAVERDETGRAVRSGYRRACVLRGLALVGWGLVLGALIALAVRAWMAP